MKYIIDAFKSLEEIDDSVVKVTPKKTNLKESLNEAEGDFYVLSDGKNPKNSKVFSEIKDLDEFIAELESAKNEDTPYAELLHNVNGVEKKIWDTEHGRVQESVKEESCDIDEANGKLNDRVDELVTLLVNDKDEIVDYGKQLASGKVQRPLYKDFAKRFVWDIYWMYKARKLFNIEYTDDINDRHIETLLRSAFKKADISLDEKDYKELTEAPEYDLHPKYDSRQSFYRKARVDVRPDGSEVLYSYGYPVCQFKDGKIYLLYHVNSYASYNSSQTTLRHVKEFIKQHGMKADSLKQIEADYPIQKGSLVESVQELNENKLIDIHDKEELAKAKEELAKDEDEQPIEQIVDVDAETVDKLKDSYIGNAVIRCRKCRLPFFKELDNLVKDDKTGFYNVEDKCPHCGNDTGFELVGQIASLDVDAEKDAEDSLSPDAETETEVKTDVEVEKEEEEKKEPKRPDLIEPEEGKAELESLNTVEDLDEEGFNRVITEYLTSIYDNVEAFKMTDANLIDESLELTGDVTYKSGKNKSVKFVFENVKVTKNNKFRFSGMNESFSDEKRAYTLVASIKENSLVCESLSYNYNIKVDESLKTVRGRHINK